MCKGSANRLWPRGVFAYGRDESACSVVCPRAKDENHTQGYTQQLSSQNAINAVKMPKPPPAFETFSLDVNSPIASSRNCIPIIRRVRAEACSKRAHRQVEEKEQKYETNRAAEARQQENLKHRKGSDLSTALRAESGQDRERTNVMINHTLRYSPLTSES